MAAVAQKMASAMKKKSVFMNNIIFLLMQHKGHKEKQASMVRALAQALSLVSHESGYTAMQCPHESTGQ